MPEPYWPHLEDVLTGCRERYGLDVVVLRLLQVSTRSTFDGGEISYLAQVDRQPDIALTPWPGADPLDDHPLRAFAKPGGPQADLAWAEAVLADLQIAQIGPAAQVRSWNLSSIWRLPTVDGQAWLKVVPPFFAHEGALLGRLDADVVPRLLGFARHTDELPPDARSRLEILIESLPGLFAAAQACGLPDSLVHGDFHRGNVRGYPGRFRILDWGDSAIGTPAFDLLRLQTGLGDGDRIALAAAWTARWQRAIPGSDPARALALLRPAENCWARPATNDSSIRSSPTSASTNRQIR